MLTVHLLGPPCTFSETTDCYQTRLFRKPLKNPRREVVSGNCEYIHGKYFYRCTICRSRTIKRIGNETRVSYVYIGRVYSIDISIPALIAQQR